MKNQTPVCLYTDGSCSPNPGPGGWACVLLYKNVRRKKSGFQSQTTNNRMELQAVIEGLRCLKQPSFVYITLDSQYVKNAFTAGWLEAWKKNGWKTKDRSDVKNKDLWLELERQIEKHEVQWQWVKGHSNHAYNEMCDELAKAAARNQEEVDVREELSSSLSDYAE